MYSHRYYHLALALLLLSAMAALVLAGVTALALDMQLTPAVAAGALGVAGALFAAMAYVHDALRAARWDAGHRLR